MGAARSLVSRVGKSQAAVDAVEASYVALRRRPARSEAAKAADGKAQYLAAEVADAVATEETCRALHAELRNALEVSSTDSLGPRARDLVDGLRVAMGFVARVRATVGVPAGAPFHEIERELGLIVRQAAQCA